MLMFTVLLFIIKNITYYYPYIFLYFALKKRDLKNIFYELIIYNIWNYIDFILKENNEKNKLFSKTFCILINYDCKFWINDK